MSRFRVFEGDEFCRSLVKLPELDRRRIQGKLETYAFPQLKQEPCFGPNIKKLRGYSPDTWRYRIGRFRLFYTVDTRERVVFMLTVERRRDAYR